MSLRFDYRMSVALIAALVAFAVTAFAPQVLNDGDTFMHIAAGQRMLADGAVLARDPFSYTFGGQPWVAHEWLAEILMALAYNAGGWSGLLAMFGIAAAVTAGILAYQVGRWLEPMAQAVVTLLALSCMTGSLLARPHILALPLLVIWMAEIVSARADKRTPSPWLLPVMAIWANIHGSFLLGLVLGAGVGLEALIDESETRARTFARWALFGAGAILVTLLNPQFVDGALHPLMLMGNTRLANVDEWQPTDFSTVQPLELVVLAGLYVILSRGVTMSPVRALMLLGLLHMALSHQRHQIVFAAVAPLLLAEPLGRAFGAAQAKASRFASFLAPAAAVAIALVAVVRVAAPIQRADGPVAPIAALSHVPAEMRGAPVLNDYSFGGYLIFEGIKPFIDSRTELYREKWLDTYAALIRPDAKTLDATLKRFDIRWSILSPASPMVAELSARGWRQVYADAYAVVQIRDNTRR